jgi:AAA domain-containing protein
VLLHVDEALNYRYMPRELALFEYTYDAIRTVRERLEAACLAKRPGRNPFVARFQLGSAVYSAIESLGPATDVAALEFLTVLTSDEEARVQTLRDKIEALAPQSLNSRLEVALSEKSLAEAAYSTGETINSFDWTAHNQRVIECQTAETNFNAAAETDFARDEIPGILSDAWRNFIEAGEAYLQGIGSRHYPEEGDRCIYCRQELGEATLTLVKKYRDYTGNAPRSKLDTAAASVLREASDIRRLEGVSLRDYANRKIEAAESGGAAHPLAAKTVVLAEQLLAIRAPEHLIMEVVDAASRQVLAREVCALAEPVAAQAAEHVRALTIQSAEREAERENCRKELRDLEDRLTLRSQLPLIRSFIDDSKWVSKASAILDTFRSLLRSLTEESKIASEDLINHDFQIRFTSECESLRAPRVNLEFPGREGAAARRKTLTNDHKLSDILSEGEQKVIALADFLAESAIRGSSGPLIFDDPVNSLDYRRLQYIVERLVELSSGHQIVVFTHNIWFATALLAKFEETRQTDRCSYYGVSSTSEQTGLITLGSHPRWDTQRQTFGRVNALIQAASSQSGETQQALIEKAYESIRNWCEVVVEQELFKKVTQRYQPHVQMTMLEQINYADLGSAASEILSLFKKACRVIEAHSQPLETLSIRPNFEELKQDWKNGQDALEAYKRRA